MIIRTKKDSIEQIKRLKLNHFKEEVFGVRDIDKIEEFFIKNPAKEYCLRDSDKASGKFFFVKDFKEAQKFIKKYKNNVTICLSANEYDENIILLGDIKVQKQFGNDVIDLTARTDKDADHRNIYKNPKYNLHTNLENNALWEIPGFSKLIKYITEHELYDLVVEFAVYDCPVGVNKENIAIFELRSEF